MKKHTYFSLLLMVVIGLMIGTDGFAVGFVDARIRTLFRITGA